MALLIKALYVPKGGKIGTSIDTVDKYPDAKVVFASWNDYWLVEFFRTNPCSVRADSSLRKVPIKIMKAYVSRYENNINSLVYAFNTPSYAHMFSTNIEAVSTLYKVFKHTLDTEGSCHICIMP